MSVGTVSGARRRLGWLCGAALLSIVGCSEPPTVPDLEVGRAVADKFMQSVTSGKAAEAWDTTTVEFKSAEGRDSFARSIKKMRWLAKPAKFTAAGAVESPLGPRAEYTYQSTDGKHQVRLLISPVSTSSGIEWQVDRIKLD